MTDKKTHYRKAFNSPYLSAADVVHPITVTIARVVLEKDKTKKTKEDFNTAYFAEKEIRPGEALKPMVLNVINSKTLSDLADSPFIDDWTDLRVTIYVDKNVKFGRDIVEGLRISDSIVQRLSGEQLEQLNAAIKENGVDLNKVLQAFNIHALDQLDPAHFDKVMKRCKASGEANG